MKRSTIVSSLKEAILSHDEEKVRRTIGDLKASEGTPFILDLRVGRICEGPLTDAIYVVLDARVEGEGVETFSDEPRFYLETIAVVGGDVKVHYNLTVKDQFYCEVDRRARCGSNFHARFQYMLSLLMSRVWEDIANDSLVQD